MKNSGNIINTNIKMCIKILFRIIRLLNIEEIINNSINEILFIYNEENNSDIKTENKQNVEKTEYQRGIDRDTLIVKIIIASSIISWLSLSKEQAGYLFIGVMLTEIFDRIFKKD